jgi:hypothetical protein
MAKSQEFATAAKHDGLDWPDLLHRILTLGHVLIAAIASVGRHLHPLAFIAHQPHRSRRGLRIPFLLAVDRNAVLQIRLSRVRCMMTRVAAQQVILWQRPSQVCDTNIEVYSAAVLARGVRANVAVSEHSDDSTDDHAKQKQHDQHQPGPDRS